MNLSNKFRIAILALTVGAMSNAQAETTVTGGMPMNVFADPGDFVVELDTAGRCGSKYFHIQRVAENFKEMTAVVLTAFSVSRRLTFFVVSCANDRNIVSHGYASR
jgi:hypothetical protein